MPTIYKVLAQSAPSSTSIANVYTVPSSTNTIISTLMICNRATVNASYNIAVVPGGAAIANQHFIAFKANTTGVNNLGFTLFGTELS